MFVDADNVPASCMQKTINIFKNRGRIVSCKVFGDFSRPALLPWRDACLTHNLEAVIAWHKSGKNSSDLKLCQACVHSMYARDVSHYVLLTGDGDFTSVVQDLKCREKYVICMGVRQQTSERLINCCDEFIDLTMDNAVSEGAPTDYTLRDDMRMEIVSLLKHEPSIDMSQICVRLLLKNPRYNAENFGVSSFKSLVEELGFEVFYRWESTRRYGPYARIRSA